MKNLKRALTLVLACAMIFGMFAINASAATAFADDDTIVNDEAVTVMSQLNIINGNEDGTFAPTRIVTRAEMCKMLCVALNGGIDPVLGADSLAIFSDTQGHWANAYISYCFNLGIVSGDSGKGGTFRPEATVTGTEAAKMMLVAMGYNSEFAKFTGAEWVTNVAVAANQKNLFKGLSTLNVAAGLTRDNAAQLIYNGINAKKVIYDNVLATDGNGVLTATARISDTNDTIISKNYGATKSTGVLLANEEGFALNGGAKTDAGYTWVDLDGDKTQDAAEELFKISTKADLLGQTVTIYYKADTRSAKFWDVCGAPVATADNKIVTFTSSRAPSQTQAKFEDAMKAEGLSTYNAAVIENNGGIATTITGAAAAYALRSGANGVVYSFIDNDGDKDVEYIAVTKPAIGKVVSYNTTGDGYVTVTALPGSNANVAAISGEKLANVIGSDAIAKDDIVSYYKMGTKWFVTKLDSVTANVTATDGGNAIADGKTYKTSNLVNKYNGVGGTAADVAAAVNLGKDSTFYLDAYGFVVYAKAAAADSKYLVVFTSDAATANTELDNIRAKVLFQDGTFATIGISKIGGAAISASNNTVTALGADAGVIYTYKELDNGTYDITATASNIYVTDVKANTPALTTASGSSIANAKTLFVVSNAAKTSASVYTGIANVPTRTGLNATTNYGITVNNADGIAKVVFTVGGTGASDAKYLYVLSDVPVITLDSKDNNVYTYKTLVNGVATDLVVTGAAADDAFAEKGLYADVAIGSDNKLAVATQKTADLSGKYGAAADAKACGNDVITGTVLEKAGTAAEQTLTYNADTKVYVIDGKTVTDGTIDEIAVVKDGAGAIVAASTTNIIMTRASDNSTNAKYSVAGIIYIVK